MSSTASLLHEAVTLTDSLLAKADLALQFLLIAKVTTSSTTEWTALRTSDPPVYCERILSALQGSHAAQQLLKDYHAKVAQLNGAYGHLVNIAAPSTPSSPSDVDVDIKGVLALSKDDVEFVKQNTDQDPFYGCRHNLLRECFLFGAAMASASKRSAQIEELHDALTSGLRNGSYTPVEALLATFLLRAYCPRSGTVRSGPILLFVSWVVNSLTMNQIYARANWLLALSDVEYDAFWSGKFPSLQVDVPTSQHGSKIANACFPILPFSWKSAHFLNALNLRPLQPYVHTTHARGGSFAPSATVPASFADSLSREDGFTEFRDALAAVTLASGSGFPSQPERTNLKKLAALLTKILERLSSNNPPSARRGPKSSKGHGASGDSVD